MKTATTSLAVLRPEIPAPEAKASLAELAEKRAGGNDVFGGLDSHAGDFSPAAHHGCDRGGKAGVSRHGGKLRPRRIFRPHFERSGGTLLSAFARDDHGNCFDVARRFLWGVFLMQSEQDERGATEVPLTANGSRLVNPAWESPNTRLTSCGS